nr:hypothetical protein [Tanacetum cinerariifolium]
MCPNFLLEATRKSLACIKLCPRGQSCLYAPSTGCGTDVCDIRTSYVSHQCTSSVGDNVAPYLLRGLATPCLLRRLAAPYLVRGLANPCLLRRLAAPYLLRGLDTLCLLRRLAAPYLLRGLATPCLLRRLATLLLLTLDLRRIICVSSDTKILSEEGFFGIRPEGFDLLRPKGFSLSYLEGFDLSCSDGFGLLHPEGFDRPRPEDFDQVSTEDKVPTNFNQNHIDYLKAHIVKHHDIPEGVLVRSGLSRVWCNPMCDLVLRRSDNTVMSIYDFLCIPSLDKVMEIAVTRPDHKVVTKADHAAKREASTRPKISTNVAKKTRSSKKGSGAGSSGLAVGDELSKLTMVLLMMDQHDGAEFAIEDIGNLNDVSQDNEVDRWVPPFLLRQAKRNEKPGTIRKTGVAKSYPGSFPQ